MIPILKHLKPFLSYVYPNQTKQILLWCWMLYCLLPPPLRAEILVIEIANQEDYLLPNITVTLQGNQIIRQNTTDKNGQCRFYALSPGQYTISYQYQEHPAHHNNIAVAPDAVTELILTTQSPHHHINYLRTGTAHDITLSMLHKSPILNATQWATVQTGISQHHNQLHFRGGRANEYRVYIDELPEPINYMGHTFTDVATANATHVTIAKSGFNAQYGQAMSGIIHIVTTQQQHKRFGIIEGITDHPSGYGQNRVSTTLGTSLFHHKATATLTTDWQKDTDADPRHSVSVSEYERNRLPSDDFESLSKGILPHNGQQRQTLRAYVSLSPTNQIKIQTRLTHAKQERQYYEHSYRYDLRHTPKIENRTQGLNTQLHYQQKNTHITARITQNTYHYHQGDGVHFDNLFAYGRPTGNPNFDDQQLFWRGDRTDTPIETNADGFFLYDEGHVYNEFLKQQINTLTPLDLQITTQLSPNHTLQAGFQLNLHTLRTYQHLTPTFISRTNQSLTNVIKYGYDLDLQTQSLQTSEDAHHPRDATFYIHTKTEFKGVIADFGMRFDYFSARTSLPSNDLAPLGGDAILEDSERVPSQSFLSLSPRVGLTLHITQQSAFHAHFGVFRQIPNYATLFTDLNYFAKRVSQLRTTYAFGYPNLQLARTSAFEMGLSHNISPQTHLDATVYFKRTVQLTQRTTILAQPTYYDTYRNTNIATLRGVELTAQLQPESFLALQVAYGYSYHTGTGISDYPEIDLSPGFPTYLGTPSARSIPLSSERRHALIAQINFQFPAAFWAHVLLRTSTGRAYTPTEPVSAQIGFLNVVPNSGALHSARSPGLFQIDLKTGKTFDLRSFQMNFFVTATNITNHFNIREVYSATGNPHVSGWLASEDGREYLTQFGETGRQIYETKEQNPLNNGSPRHILFGTLIRF